MPSADPAPSPLRRAEPHSARKLCTFPWMACGAPEYFRRHGTPRTPADLSEHNLIGFRNRVTGQLDSWRFRDPADGSIVRHSPRPLHTFDDPEAAWEMIRAGFGIGYGPAWMGTQDWERETVIETLRAWRGAEPSLHLVKLDRRMTPKRVQAVQKFIIDSTRAWHEGFARSNAGRTGRAGLAR